MMHMFTIVPLVGPDPLHFGMTPAQVELLLGPPDRVIRTPFGTRSEVRAGVSLGFDVNSGQLVEAVFSGGSLLFEGSDLFQLVDPVEFLRKFDCSPQFAVGIVFFLKLGVSFTGFTDDSDSQRSISVAAQGRWEEIAEDFVPY